VHVLLGGTVVLSGGPELADKLEATGYEGIAAELGIDELTVEVPAEEPDPFADPF
jgi:Fe-S cluster assembly ATP-binding protein